MFVALALVSGYFKIICDLPYPRPLRVLSADLATQQQGNLVDDGAKSRELKKLMR
jgi:hypothetical protein